MDLEKTISSNTQAVVLLDHSSQYIISRQGRDYNDLKSCQLLVAIKDLILANMTIESWMADLGTIGCCGDQGDNSSIGGISCIMSNEE